MDSQLVRLFGIMLGSGVAGMVIGAIGSVFSRDERLRLGNSMGVGFLIGAAIGTTVGVFLSITARL
jgi:hypothetical protein